MNANPNKALWEKGDFTRIAESMRESGEALVAGLGITKGLKVLDLGCGDGTTALPAASWARTSWASTSRATSSRPATGARAEGLTNCRFQEGDATNLQRPRGRQLRPRGQHLRRDVRAQAVRRGQGDGARHPARAAGSSWETGFPNDPTLVAQILKISSAYSPPPPEGFISPMTWGIESNVIERFGGRRGRGGEDLVLARDVHLQLPSRRPVRGRLQGLLRAHDERLRRGGKNGRGAELQKELEALFDARTRAATDATSIPATFLRVTVQR